MATPVRGDKDEEQRKLIDVWVNLERQQNEDRRRQATEATWRAVGIAGLVMLAATLTKVPFGDPYEGEHLSLALFVGLLVQLGLDFIGAVYAAVITYRIGKWAFFKVQARGRA